jgi:aminoglycoside phosphotransferase (APT) family kinase protein
LHFVHRSYHQFAEGQIHAPDQKAQGDRGDGGKPGWTLIGRGKSSEVLSIGNGKIIKIYHSAVSEEMIQREMRAAGLAASLGLPTVAPCSRVSVKEKSALIYPEIYGVSVASAVRKEPFSAATLLTKMADLLRTIHSPTISGLRQVKTVLATDIDYGPAPDAIKKVAIEYLAHLPDGDHLLHGDFHIDNILLSDGDLIILDWAKAAMGAPAADVVRSEMLMRFGEGPADPITALWRDWAARHLSRAYRDASGTSISELNLWRPVVALAWLRARPPVRSRAFHRYLNQALRTAGLPTLS